MGHRNIKAQFSLEYMIITGIILAILVGAIYAFSYFGVSTKKDIKESVANKMAEVIVDKSSEVFYSAGYAKRTLAFAEIGSIESIATQSYKYLIINTSDRELVYESDVPIVSLIGPDGLKNKRSIVIEKKSGFVAICTEDSCACAQNETGLCDNAIDDDCDGKMDMCDLDCGADNDGDGWIGGGCGDCNDNGSDPNAPLMFPGNPEVLDGLDNDCDGKVDNGFICSIGFINLPCNLG